jgi:hypothetical protein
MNHRPSSPRHTLVRPLAVGLCLSALLCSLPAWAGNVSARAGQNPDFVQDVNGGATASANWGPIEGGGFARADTSRTHLEMATLGHGGSSSLHLNATASHRTDYQLWDLSTDTALPAAIANLLVIDFSFRLQGLMAVEAVSLSNSSFQWSASVLAGSQNSSAGSTAQIVFGPVPGNIAGEYLFTGDASLHGAFDQVFSLQHESARNGILRMSLNGLSGNRAETQAQLSLVGLTYSLVDPTLWPAAGGDLSLGGLGPIGIRFSETGEVLAISPVPEMGTGLLWASGAVVLAWLRRRRAVA